MLIPRLMKEIADAEPIVRALYVRILTRHPNRDELQAMLDLDPGSPAQKSQQKFYFSVAWALVNWNEFLFNH